MKLRVTVVAEYEAEPDHYVDCDGDPKKMAALDQQSLDEGDMDVIELLVESDFQSVTVEPVGG